MKGKIPITSTLILESIEDQWRLLIDGLVNNLNTTALVTSSNNKTVRVKKVIKENYPHERINISTNCTTITNLENSNNNGLSIIHEFTIKLIDKERWIFIGYIDGEKKLPIIIVYYSFINLAIYSLKLSTENIQNFKNLANLN